MRAFLKRQWFLTTLGLLIALGLALGATGNASSVQPITDRLNPRWITAGVLFLMALSLDTGKLWQAFRSPGPVMLGFAINYGAIPLAAWLLMPLQHSTDFQFGLMIAASVPCTTAAASVMTRKAGGNDAVSLLTTLATNTACFALTPFWLGMTTATKVSFDSRTMMLELAQAVLLPTILGQLLRQPLVVKREASRYKTPLGVVAQVLIELMVLTAAMRAGAKLHEVQVSAAPTSSPATAGNHVTLQGVLVVWISCVAVHGMGLAAGWYASRALRISRGNAAAVAFAGSQKTLPIGLYVATNPATFGLAFPFAMLPMLLFHASQLFIDTAISARMAAVEPAAPPPAPIEDAQTDESEVT
jgi:sodium/bile acid cotransporter 7